MKSESNLHNLFLAGVSHWNTPAEVREQFSLSQAQMIRLFELAKSKGIRSVFSISTCNRTEIYVLAENAELAMELFVQATRNPQPATLRHHIYIKQGQKAAEHLFNVSAGLDAQILGDAQITGQIREFHQLALKYQALDAVLNRLVELAISAGKEVKTQTQMSGGVASVAHAAVLAAMRNMQKPDFRALVIGTGKTGKLILKSLLKYVPAKNITLLNRTDKIALELAQEFATNAAAFTSLKNEVESADVIFAATASAQFIITPELFNGVALDGKLFIDLSLPRNISPGLNAAVINIDGLTESADSHRDTYVSIARHSISEGLAAYTEWLHRYELAQKVKSHIVESVFDNDLDDDGEHVSSKFIDGIASRHVRHFQKAKQSRNLAA